MNALHSLYVLIGWMMFMIASDAFVLYILHKMMKVIHMQSYK